MSQDKEKVIKNQEQMDTFNENTLVKKTAIHI